MSEENKKIARRFLTAFAAGDTTTLEEITAADVVDHSAPPGVTSGRRGLLDAVAMFRSAFPDLKITIEQEVADGEFAAVFGQVIGTNHGSMMGCLRRGTWPRLPIWTCIAS